LCFFIFFYFNFFFVSLEFVSSLVNFTCPPYLQQIFQKYFFGFLNRCFSGSLHLQIDFLGDTRSLNIKSVCRFAGFCTLTIVFLYFFLLYFFFPVVADFQNSRVSAVYFKTAVTGNSIALLYGVMFGEFFFKY